jgi:hypothetical protein
MTLRMLLLMLLHGLGAVSAEPCGRGAGAGSKARSR